MFKLLAVILFCRVSHGFISYPFSSNVLLNRVIQTLDSSSDANTQRSFTVGSDCNRPCDSAAKPKICYFKWVLEMYPTMSGACRNCTIGVSKDCFNSQCVLANGCERIFMAINRQLPGPPVEVCVNDLIVVDVVNEMEGSDTTIHWHGYAQQTTPFMDGVPYVTQCPIHFGSTFRYTFKALEEGSFLYHSHAGNQKSNGLYGALVVRRKENSKLYDFDLSEHVVVLSDWMNALTEDFFPGKITTSSYPQSLLINGHGRYFNKQTKQLTKAPVSVFHVNENMRYKFRLIGASSNVCALQFQVEKHNFTIIATDSVHVKPFVADKLTISSGERFDIVINADRQDKDSFWIRLSVMDPCKGDNAIEEFAVLQYYRNKSLHKARYKMMHIQDVENPDASLFSSTIELNSIFAPALPITVLESYIDDKALLAEHPEKIFYLAFGLPLFKDNDAFSGKLLHRYLVMHQPLAFSSVGVVNKISFVFPEVPMLSQHEEIDESQFCNKTNLDKEKCYSLNEERGDICFCTHRIIAPEHSLIEFVVMNFALTQHPFHLHGHQFAVIESGVFNQTLSETRLKPDLMRIKDFKRNPVYKDTVIIPGNGYTRLRYKSHSASLLFFHCHYDFHLQVGMAGILQIGELKDLPKPPKKFPQCRSFLPKV